MSHPVVFAAPARTELQPAPIPAHWIIEGKPQARSKRLAASADRASAVIAWTCTPGRFNWHYMVDETVHIISGEVFVTDENGEVHRLGPGDMAFSRRQRQHVAGYQGVRKLAFCRHSMPLLLGFALRVWNKLSAYLLRLRGG